MSDMKSLPAQRLDLIHQIRLDAPYVAFFILFLICLEIIARSPRRRP